MSKSKGGAKSPMTKTAATRIAKTTSDRGFAGRATKAANTGGKSGKCGK